MLWAYSEAHVKVQQRLTVWTGGKVDPITIMIMISDQALCVRLARRRHRYAWITLILHCESPAHICFI